MPLLSGTPSLIFNSRNNKYGGIFTISKNLPIHDTFSYDIHVHVVKFYYSHFRAEKHIAQEW